MEDDWEEVESSSSPSPSQRAPAPAKSHTSHMKSKMASLFSKGGGSHSSPPSPSPSAKRPPPTALSPSRASGEGELQSPEEDFALEDDQVLLRLAEEGEEGGDGDDDDSFTEVSKDEIPAYLSALSLGEAEEPEDEGAITEDMAGLLRAAGFDVPENFGALPKEAEERLLRQGALKKRLFQVIFEEEYARFLQSPEMLQESGTMLAAIYAKFMTCPLFTSKHSSVGKVQELVLTLPLLHSKMHRESQRRMEVSIRDSVVSLYRFSDRTDLEAQFELQRNLVTMTQFVEPPPAEGPDGSAAPPASPAVAAAAKETHGRSRKRLFSLLTLVSADMEKNGGADHLFRVFREAQSLQELPPVYLRLTEQIRKLLLPFFVRLMEDEEKMAQVRSLYNKLPKALLKGILKISNPMKMIARLTGLLSKDVVGNKTFMQHLMISMMGVKQARKKLALVGKGLPREQQEAIDRYLEQNHEMLLADGNLQEFYQSGNFIKVVLQMGDVDPGRLGPEELGRCRAYLDTLTKVKEREGLVEVVRSDQMRSVIKAITPIIQDLLTEIYVVSSLPKLFAEGLAMMKEMVDLSEKNFKSPQEADEAYRIFTVQLAAITFNLLHNVATKEDGPVHQLVHWLLGLSSSGVKRRYLDEALLKLSEEEQERLWKEAQSLYEYFKMGGNGMGLGGEHSPEFLTVLNSVREDIRRS